MAPSTLLLPVTGATAGALGLVCSGLALSVAAPRFIHGLGLGTPKRNDVLYGPGKGEDKEEWEQRIRSHANATEHAPIFLIMLGALELNQLLTTPQLVAIGAVFTAGRVMHSAQLAKPKVVPLIFRPVGFFTQVGICIGAGITLLSKCVKHCKK